MGKTYEIVMTPTGNPPQIGIKCLVCDMTSWNPNDVTNRYCGNCHRFHEDVAPGSMIDLLDRTPPNSVF